jgi:hypothetical protein
MADLFHCMLDYIFHCMLDLQLEYHMGQEGEHICGEKPQHWAADWEAEIEWSHAPGVPRALPQLTGIDDFTTSCCLNGGTT